MALYEFKCDGCGKVIAVRLGPTEKLLPFKCEVCGGNFVRIMSLPTIHSDHIDNPHMQTYKGKPREI